MKKHKITKVGTYITIFAMLLNIFFGLMPAQTSFADVLEDVVLEVSENIAATSDNSEQESLESLDDSNGEGSSSQEQLEEDNSEEQNTNQQVQLSAPGIPINVVAVAGDGQAEVSFEVPDSDGGSPITQYTVISNLGGITATGTSSPIVISGLTNETEYTFTVSATNEIGSGLDSQISNSVTPKQLTEDSSENLNTDQELQITVPGAPANVVAIAGNGQAEVSFEVPDSDGGSAITEYTVTANPGGIIATGTGSPIVITGLTNGTEYTFTVSATNEVGAGVNSQPSNSIAPVEEVQLTVPGAPVNVMATAGNGQAEVSFDAPSSNGGSEITQYTVTSNPGGITATGTGSPIVITGLTNGTEYTFTVYATNEIGNGVDSEISNLVVPNNNDVIIDEMYSAGSEYHINLNFELLEDIDDLTKKEDENIENNTDNIIEALNDSLIKDITVYIQEGQRIIQSDVFNTLKGNEKVITFEEKSAEGELIYSWKFDGKKLDKEMTEGINLSISFDPIIKNEIITSAKESLSTEDVFFISFDNHGDLPGVAEITIKVDEKWMEKKYKDDLSLYYYNPESKKLESVVNNLIVDENGYVKFELDHNSDYILVGKDIEENNGGGTTPDNGGNMPPDNGGGTTPDNGGNTPPSNGGNTPPSSGSGSSSNSNSGSSTGNSSSTTTNNNPTQLAEGWNLNSKEWKYIKNGQVLKGWNQVNGSWYLMNSAGVMLTGWQQVNGTWYLLKSSGAMSTGWQQVNGTWYLLKSSGAMATGWQQVNGTWYLLKNNGAMASGWQKINGTWYLLRNDGAMATGWQKVNGTWYLFKSDGALVTD